MKKQANSLLSLTSIGWGFVIHLIHLKSWLLPDRAVPFSLLPSQALIPLPRQVQHHGALGALTHCPSRRLKLPECVTKLHPKTSQRTLLMPR